MLAMAACVHAKPVKFRLHTAAGNGPLATPGVKVLADYGSFQVIEAEETLAGVLLAAGAEPAAGSDRIELNAGPLDTRRPEVVALRQRAGTFIGRRPHLVQFVGPVKPEWRTALETTGVQVVHYVPQNAYLVRGDAEALARLQTWAASTDFIQWDGAFTDDYKLHPLARVRDAQGRPLQPATELFTIQLVEDVETNPATLALIERFKLEPVRHRFRTLQYLNVTVRLPAGRLAEIATQSDVISIHPHFPRRKLDERQSQILAGNLSGNVPSGPGYLAWLAGKGFTQAQFTASGSVVDVTDSGLDNGTLLPGHFGLYENGDKQSASRVAYNRLEGIPNFGSTLEACDGHGNLNAHIIAGHDDLSGFPFRDASGYHYGLGLCPFVKVGASVIFDPDFFTYPDYADLQSRAWQDGARISCNSWGALGNGVYDSDSQCYDALARDAQPSGSAFAAAGNQPMTLVFAASNDGPLGTTVCSPGTAKNVITVGAGEGVQAFGGTDGSGVSDAGADSANDIINFSSRGPCTDGRIKPDLMAPGTHISGGVAQVDNPAFAGTAIGCFNGFGVSGGASGALFFPSSQEFYTASSGTSHSTPAIAGCCALVRQYFLNHSLSAPSPAMTKAYLMNSARHMIGVGANDTLPSNNQGMGAANLGMAFDGTARVLRDQLAQDKFVASGETRTFTGTVGDSAKPFRVTLAWTDAPGSTVGNAYNNDLDLAVTIGGATYKGNVFSGASSIAGGAADAKNNVESVFLPAGVTGPYTVTVTAANINSDGVPNEAPEFDQDFALVIYNAPAAPSPGVLADGWTLAAESCIPINGRVDAGEAVIVNLALRNAGPVDASNVVATLLAAGGVTSPSGPQTYGLLPAGGGAVTQAFSFTAQGSCGDFVNATLSLTNNGTNLGAVGFQISLGGWQNIITQNFDTVTAPALPVGWTTTSSGGQENWTTTNAPPDSPPNVAISGESESLGVNELTSPVINLPTGAARLSFRHRLHLESDGLKAYDGSVLEIKIGAGDWQDILVAGGNFLRHGYTHFSTNASDNPLAGRQMWSGNSAGFLHTLVELPAAAAGQNLQLRWRCGTDSGTGGGSWQVDSVSLSSQICCTPGSGGTPTVTLSTPGYGPASGQVLFNLIGTTGYTWVVQASSNLINWTPIATNNVPFNFSQTNGPGAPQRFYRARLWP